MSRILSLYIHLLLSSYLRSLSISLEVLIFYTNLCSFLHYWLPIHHIRYIRLIAFFSLAPSSNLLKSLQKQ